MRREGGEFRSFSDFVFSLKIFHFHCGVMGCGAVEATGLGFVCFVVLH